MCFSFGEFETTNASATASDDGDDDVLIAKPLCTAATATMAMRLLIMLRGDIVVCFSVLSGDDD